MKTIPDLPKALYGCAIESCAEEYSHPSEDLVMVTRPPEGWDPGWYCEGCADEAYFQDPCTKIGESLESHLVSEEYRGKKVTEELLAACREFVRKVECGLARSVRSYRQMKAAIAKYEEMER